MPAAWTRRRVKGVLVVLVAMCAALVAAIVVQVVPRDASSSVPEPRPTSTPQAPGISIAVSRKLDLPDPFLLAVHGTYYLYLSTAFADPLDSNIPLLVGRPGHWREEPDALPAMPKWGLPATTGSMVWSPEVVRRQGRYVMYFAAQVRGSSPPMHCIGTAVARTPAGPFVPVPGPPIVCQTAIGGDIDAQVFVDPTGQRGPAHPDYLVWKSDQNSLPNAGPTEIWAAPLARDGLHLAGPAVEIYTAQLAWQKPVLEAPQMVRAPDGTDWLFYSAGTGYFSSRYAMGVAKCAGPLGGCHDVGSAPFLASNAQGSGPGEETVYVSPDASTWILYSPWHTREVLHPARPVEAVRVGWRGSKPYLAEAGRFPPP